MSRPGWDAYFLKFVETAALRATCDRGRSGCVIVKGNRILVTGYVGAPSGFPDCDEAGHLIEKVTHQDGTVSEHCKRTIHAEQNAILQAARMGIALEESTLYCSMTPCRDCAMSIVQVGIVRVVCLNKYHQGKISEEIFKWANIELVFANDSIVKYPSK